MGEHDETVLAFDALPRRLFLDSSALQFLHNYGEFVWENQQPPPNDRIYSIPGGFREIDALRAIFFVNQRAMFEFALSEHSLEEVTASGNRRYLQWAYDVLDHWQACIDEYHEPPFVGSGATIASRLGEKCFGYLSAKDSLLLQDALKAECDAFLTMDQKLAKNTEHLYHELGLRVLLPSQYWGLLRPWARIFV